MNKKQALAEARRRWGKKANVEIRYLTIEHKTYAALDESGNVIGFSGIVYYPAAWEEVFQDADARLQSKAPRHTPRK